MKYKFFLFFILFVAASCSRETPSVETSPFRDPTTLIPENEKDFSPSKSEIARFKRDADLLLASVSVAANARASVEAALNLGDYESAERAFNSIKHPIMDRVHDFDSRSVPACYPNSEIDHICRNSIAASNSIRNDFNKMNSAIREYNLALNVSRVEAEHAEIVQCIRQDSERAFDMAFGMEAYYRGSVQTDSHGNRVAPPHATETPSHIAPPAYIPDDISAPPYEAPPPYEG